MSRRTARSVCSICVISGSPPAAASVAATMENLWTSSAMKRLTRAGSGELTCDTAGPPPYAALAEAAFQYRDANPRQMRTPRTSPSASILTSEGALAGAENPRQPTTIP